MCVLFASVRPLERAENLKAVYDAYDGEKQYVQRGIRGSLEGINSGRYRVLVTDELTNESPGKVLFIGHGAGAGKTYGLDQPFPYYHNPKAITYAIASSEAMVPHVARQLGISESQVIPLGFPRMDAYIKAVPAQPEKFWLFAPTFRNWPLKVYYDEIQWYMPSDYQLIVKPHMIQPDVLNVEYDNIKVASAHIPSTPYLLKMSALITDYSSIMFDAMVLRKPYVLFAKDRNRYLAKRGMYYQYPEGYSTRFCEHERDLVPMLQEAKWDDDCEQYRDFYVGACDGHSVEKTVKLIKEML